jgi:hypothetical protein
MELTVTRVDNTPERCIGRLYGKYGGQVVNCYTLEDTDRLLDSSMPLEVILNKKVWGATAIPYGRYEVVISYSNRFKKLLPLLVGVPGFTGIRLHALNRAVESHGCIGPGLGRTEDSITYSRKAMALTMALILKALKKEKVYITVKAA